ncbi:type II toxin-antitoxin system PemK/MazF family toxin [Microbacterium bovistercoris]|uniref:Type II toxin-antitoxin system PemK/MazF family toxin n=1 Tax=Microbacterium bovistercoris TaxID=2293570 RepID=A0A371NSA7_9MICO|nr:type II toxin-antitoxin system PemK/MazF family toxin [Microbacterium bovistercoris]REJ05096.1 type II toxin-antitoxin system PemK/MazF family toxin [Microbacterium bovistercoris]
MIFRGAIYEIKALPGARGREQQGARLAVIIQSDAFASSTVTVAMTSTSAGSAVYRPEIDVDGVRTRILTDQIYSIDAGRLGTFRGGLESAEIAALDRALLLKLGLF